MAPGRFPVYSPHAHGFWPFGPKPKATDLPNPGLHESLQSAAWHIPAVFRIFLEGSARMRRPRQR